MVRSVKHPRQLKVFIPPPDGSALPRRSLAETQTPTVPQRPLPRPPAGAQVLPEPSPHNEESDGSESTEKALKQTAAAHGSFARVRTKLAATKRLEAQVEARKEVHRGQRNMWGDDEV